MNKEFVTYNQALALRELGFDEQCFSFYNIEGELYESEGYYRRGYNVHEDEVIAPLYQQAFRWFRDKHSFIGIPTISNYSDDRYVFDIFQKGNEEIYFEGSDLSDRNNGNKEYNTYEEAESACLDKLIEIVKNKSSL
jgi:hypothetical protein